MSKKQDAINRHEEIEDLIGSPPSWLTRWGISILVAIIVFLLIGACFFRYPETISSPVVITAEYPAIWLVSRTSGYIDSIYVKDQSNVSKDQIIAVIENTGSIEAVFTLKKELNQLFYPIQTKNIDSLTIITRNLNVGELNDNYNHFIKLIDNYILFLREKYHNLRIDFLIEEKKKKQEYLKNIEQQNKSYIEYSKIMKNQYLRDSLLYIKKVISKDDFESAKKEKISSDIQLYQSFGNLSTIRLEIHKLDQEIAETGIDFTEMEKAHYNNLIASYELLYNDILEWEKMYIIKSPSAGKISFLKFWSKNQHVTPNEKIFTIIPDDYGNIVGKCSVSTFGIGKVKEGQKVLIKLNEFPYMEYGMLKGQVSNISLIGFEANNQENQSNRYAIIEINFNEKYLKSTYNKMIDFKGELTGVAEIEIKQMSLLEHLINPLKYLWSNIEN